MIYIEKDMTNISSTGGVPIVGGVGHHACTFLYKHIVHFGLCAQFMICIGNLE